jgi:hypothetical protein
MDFLLFPKLKRKMGYIFFHEGVFPTSEETAKHFQEVFHAYSHRPDLAKNFHEQVLKPFGKAMTKFRENTDYFPWNPFIGGVFTKINGVSIWNTLFETKHVPHRRMLLALLLVWGFGSHDEYGWTQYDEDKLFEEFENSDILLRAQAFELD